MAADYHTSVDPRWAQLYTQRLSLELEHTLAIHEAHQADLLGGAVGGYRVGFSDGLYRSSTALEGTALAALRL